MKKPKVPLTQERVRELLDVDIETGITKRKTNGPRYRVGDIITCKDGGGYLRVMLDGVRYRLHRVIWLWWYGYWPENDIDHISRDRTDNSISNLREVAPICNARNASKRKDNNSGVKGVCKHQHTGKWTVQMSVMSIVYYLGVFDDFIEAVAHRLAAEQCCDWIDCESSTPAYLHMQKYLKGEV